MPNMTTWTDDQVFGNAGEQPGSQMAHERDIEIRRRLYGLEREALTAQLAAIEEQRSAIVAQREATSEMQRQSRLLLASVLGIFATAIVTLIAAVI